MRTAAERGARPREHIEGSFDRAAEPPAERQMTAYLQVLDRCDRGVERRVEVVGVEGLEEPVAQRHLLQAGSHLGEREVDPLGVQLVVEVLEHRRRGHVDVGDGLALQHDPPRLALADQADGSAGGRRRRWRRTAGPPSGTRRCRELPGVGLVADAMPAVDALRPDRGRRRGATSCGGRTAGSPARWRRRCPGGRRGASRRAWRPARREGARAHLADSGAARARSMSDSAAAITTAASAAWGRSASSAFRNSRSTATSAGPDQAGDLALGARLVGHRGS